MKNDAQQRLVHLEAFTAAFLFSSGQIAAVISGLMSVMTASQLRDARLLIPCAFELNAPPHRANRAASVVPAAALEEVRTISPSNTPNVVAAPTGPTTRLGSAAAILWDLVLVMAIIYGVAVVPALVVWAVKAVTTFVSAL